MVNPDEVRDLGFGAAVARNARTRRVPCSVAATAETYTQVVRARTSYVAEEVIFNARFLNILEWTESGSASVDDRRIGEVERVA